MSMYRVFSCVVGRGCLLWPVHSLGRTLLGFALLRSVLQGQICLLLQVALDFLLFHSSSLWWKGHLFWVLILEGLVGLHRTVQLQLLQRYWLEHRLGNRDQSVISESASKCCILDSFVDYDGCSISSKGLLPTVVDITKSYIYLKHLNIKKNECMYIRCAVLSCPVMSDPSWPDGL